MCIGLQCRRHERRRIRPRGSLSLRLIRPAAASDVDRPCPSSPFTGRRENGGGGIVLGGHAEAILPRALGILLLIQDSKSPDLQCLALVQFLVVVRPHQHGVRGRDHLLPTSNRLAGVSLNVKLDRHHELVPSEVFPVIVERGYLHLRHVPPFVPNLPPHAVRHRRESRLVRQALGLEAHAAEHARDGQVVDHLLHEPGVGVERQHLHQGEAHPDQLGVVAVRRAAVHEDAPLPLAAVVESLDGVDQYGLVGALPQVEAGEARHLLLEQVLRLEGHAAVEQPHQRELLQVLIARGGGLFRAVHLLV
mmetsp:Transcript_3829/g.8064  ORF Transcript_3829/g.8064 Transcript_3829/m.8064 type:complete len:306 (-) Transcript_3829:313-1230(-)